jgi:hypothetical protein
MFLVKDRHFGMDNFVFTHLDPRPEGYKGDVLEDVTPDYDMNAIHSWPAGHPAPNPYGRLLLDWMHILIEVAEEYM